MSKAKYSVELKLEIVKEYESGKESYKSLAEKHGVGEKSVREWIKKYREQGELGLRKRHGNAS